MTDKEIEDIVTLRILAGETPCIRCFAPREYGSVFCAPCYQAWMTRARRNKVYVPLVTWVWGKSGSIPQWVKRVYPVWSAK